MNLVVGVKVALLFLVQYVDGLLEHLIDQILFLVVALIFVFFLVVAVLVKLVLVVGLVLGFNCALLICLKCFQFETNLKCAKKSNRFGGEIVGVFEGGIRVLGLIILHNVHQVIQ